MAMKHRVEFTASAIIVRFRNTGDVDQKVFTFTLPWDTTAALATESTTYTRTDGNYSAVIQRSAGATKRLIITTKETILASDNEYGLTTMNITANAGTPANWDINTNCKYAKNTGAIDKQANRPDINLTTATINTTELTMTYDTLIASSVLMFVLS